MLVYQRVQETPNLKAWTRSCSVAELREASAMTSNIEDGIQVLLTSVFFVDFNGFNGKRSSRI